MNDTGAYVPLLPAERRLVETSVEEAHTERRASVEYKGGSRPSDVKKVDAWGALGVQEIATARARSR